MWSQEWGNAYDLVVPYPDADSPLAGITDAMIEQVTNLKFLKPF